MSADQRFNLIAEQLGYSFDGEIKIGGNYVPLIRHNDEIYISGQIPRVGDKVVVTGRAGADTTLAQAQLAAKVCAMRALALLQRSAGSLDGIKRLLRMNLYCNAPRISLSKAKWPTRLLRCCSSYWATSVRILARQSGSISCRRTPPLNLT